MFDFLKKKLGEIFHKVGDTITGSVKAVEKTITEKKLDQKSFDSVFWQLELALLENNVSSEVVEKIKLELASRLVGSSIKRDFKGVIMKSLKEAFNSVLFEVKEEDFLKKVKSKKPFVIMFVGINGSGKTTTLAKIANFLKSKKFACVFAAGDTFRAASIEQLKVHADKLGFHVVAGEYGCDSASVAFDAVKYAESKKLDVVLVDTAGRLQSDINLMDELLKVKKVSKPDMVIFVADSLTGNDVVEQAKVFNDKVGVDYVVLTKSDVDSKGGAILSVGYTIKKPILFLGTGQGYKDLKLFNKDEVLGKLF